MDFHELIQIFNEIGLLLELKGENPFKSRAYVNAARILEQRMTDVERLIQEGRIGELAGFGEALSAKVAEWARTGRIAYYDELKNSIPPGLLELLRVPGLGTKKINLIYRELGISSLEDLESACTQNKLIALPGFGVKTQLKLLAGIEFLREHRGQRIAFEVWNELSGLKEVIQNQSGVERIEVAGSMRRFKETVHDTDLVAAGNDPAAIIRQFIALPQVDTVLNSGSTKASVVLKSGVQADLRAVAPEQFPHALQHFTGSKEHNTALRHLAKELGYKVNEYGLFMGEKAVLCRDEAEIYSILGLDYIPPELREGMGEIEAAREGKLPKLAQIFDLQGVFHVHTNASDGVNSLREMVEACIERGYRYLGITDHSQSAVYAGGLSIPQLIRQFEAIDQLNSEYPEFKIFKGIESDILQDGGLDYPDDILAQCDLVIGSVHSHFQMDRAVMTERLLRALDHPYLTMLGHPTGRILLQRPGYAVDLDQVIDRAVQNHVVIEFNASPYRLDLDWRWCKKVKERGGWIAVNPDAHNVNELDLARVSLATARKGWLEAGDILNCRSVDEVEAFFAKKRKSGMDGT